MQEIRRQGTTIFYVSHAAASVRSMCDRVLVLESGRLNFDGDVAEGIRYLQYDDDLESDEPMDELDEGDMDEELGADI
jgi:ABC-2 type transport system ATP-binding protein